HPSERLFGQNGERDAGRRLGRHRRPHVLVLPLEDAEDRGLEERLLVVEATIDGSRCEAGVAGDPWNGGPLPPTLPPDLDGGLHQLPPGFAAALLAGLERLSHLGHASLYQQRAAAARDPGKALFETSGLDKRRCECKYTFTLSLGSSYFGNRAKERLMST